MSETDLDFIDSEIEEQGKTTYKGWFHFFRELIQDGTWAKMSLSAGKLYPVIKSYCNHKNGYTFPSYDTMAEKSGLALNSVSRGLKDLEKLGILVVVSERKVGKKNNYSLTETFRDVQDANGKKHGDVVFPYIPLQTDVNVKELIALINKGIPGQTIVIKNLNFFENSGPATVVMGNQLNVEMKDGAKEISTDYTSQFEGIFNILDEKSSSKENQ